MKKIIFVIMLLLSSHLCIALPDKNTEEYVQMIKDDAINYTSTLGSTKNYILLEPERYGFLLVLIMNDFRNLYNFFHKKRKHGEHITHLELLYGLEKCALKYALPPILIRSLFEFFTMYVTQNNFKKKMFQKVSKHFIAILAERRNMSAAIIFSFMFGQMLSISQDIIISLLQSKKYSH